MEGRGGARGMKPCTEPYGRRYYDAAVVDEAQALKEQQKALKAQLAEAERQRNDLMQQAERRKAQAVAAADAVREHVRAFLHLQETLDRCAIHGLHGRARRGLVLTKKGGHCACGRLGQH